MPVNSTSPQTLQNRKPHRNLTSTGRPRGRPPNVNKYFQHVLQQSGNVMSQFSSKSNFTNYMGASGPNRSMINPYFMNPLVDTNMLSAILASGLSSNMMDPITAMTYLNQVNYQDIFRQYQNNLSSLTNLASGLNNPGTTITSISNVPTMSTTSSSSINTSSNIANLNNLKGTLDPMTASVQQLLSLSNSTVSTSRPTPMYHQAAKTSTTMSITKDRPNISITPVSTSMSQQPHHKVKQPGKQPSSQIEPALPVHIPKSLQISPTKPVLHSSNTTTQVSLLKPSIIQQVKSSPPKQMGAPQIRVSKSLTEPQPAHNPSLSHSPLKNSSTITTNPVAAMSHVAHASMNAPVIMKQQQAMPMNLPNVSRSGTSLQHKLLSKKNSRPYSMQTNVQNHPVRKAKSTTKATVMPVPMSGNFSNLLNTVPSVPTTVMSQPPFIPPELSGISVSPVGSQPGSIKATAASAKYHSYKKSISKPKPPVTSAMEVPSSLSASFPPGSSVEALSMLSQLQQHSHLEIIPQQKAPLKPSIDYSKTHSSSVSVVPPKVPETLRSSADCISMYDISRGKTAVSNKKTQDKLLADNVEIITLDD